MDHTRNARPAGATERLPWYRQVFYDRENAALLMASPLIAVHLACIAVFWVGISWIAVAVCLFTYVVRVFALTAGFHRYFSHKAFKTSRLFQFVLAFLGTSAGQLGPLWWASHHRTHHAYSDTEGDVHSPVLKGMWWSHVGWVLGGHYQQIDFKRIKDFLKFPELRLLDRFHVIAPLALGFSLYGVGHGMAGAGFQTSGWQLVVWGYFISSVLVYHATFCVNSVTHIVGRKRFKTRDESRNNWWVALLTLGEGWHNNHHRYPASARQGLYWWEVDVTYYLLRVLERLGVVWDLRMYPAKLFEEAERLRDEMKIEMKKVRPKPLAG